MSFMSGLQNNLDEISNHSLRMAALCQTSAAAAAMAGLFDLQWEFLSSGYKVGKQISNVP